MATTVLETKNSQNHHYFHIVACGYRYVKIPKSGLTFPAWKLTFGDDESCRWRSKRDFWRLGRVTKLQQQYQSLQLPAAAWRKLGQAAPWKAPTLSSTEGSVAATAVNDEGNINNWKPHMTKSLRLLNQYLQRVQDFCSDSGAANPDVVLAWETFCRPGDTDDIEPLPNTSTAAAPGDDEGDGPTSIPSDGDYLGSTLGQYFCSPASGCQLVQCFWDRLRPHMTRSLCPPNKEEEAVAACDYLRIVEPSCGHGDIIRCIYPLLVRTQQQVLNNGTAVSILGLDLDPSVLHHCRRLQYELEESLESPSPLSTLVPIQWGQADFLRTRPSDFNIDARHHSSIRPVVAMVGGPPYSAGAGNWKDDDDDSGTTRTNGMQHDLPIRFVEHAIHVWKAVVVAFLMPERCRNATFQIPADYDYQTIELEHGSTFYFRGTKEVTQPSVIQCFWKQTDQERVDISQDFKMEELT